MNSAPVITCTNLCKNFGSGERRQMILSGVNLTVRAGESVSIAGTSGSGKTTLLHLLGGLDTPDQGTAAVNNQSWASLTPAQAARWRNQNLGFVFQFHLLLPEFSALENIAMPLLIRRRRRSEALAAAAEYLRRLGLAAHAQKTPAQLSGGERQRVAVARALVSNPACVLADEPTGNLDRHNATAVFDLMLESAAAQGTAVVVVSHDEQLATRTARRAELIDGKLEELK